MKTLTTHLNESLSGMEANKEQWLDIKKAVKSKFGRKYKMREEYGQYKIYGGDMGIPFDEADKLYDVLKSLGYDWTDLQKTKDNPTYARFGNINTADFKVIK